MVDVLNPFLRARQAWMNGQSDEALRILQILLGAENGEPAFRVPPSTVAALAAGPFENFVARLAMDQELLVPFGVAVARLWKAMPGQYVVRALELRLEHTSGVDEPAMDVLYEAAGDGLLSNLMADHGDVAWVTLRAPDYPCLAAALDWGRLEERLRDARVRGARRAFIKANPELMANLLLYGVFHRTEVVHPESVADSLSRCGESDPELLMVAAPVLAGWARRPDAAEIARIGLRNAGGAPEQLARLADAVAKGTAQSFTEFVDTCVAG